MEIVIADFVVSVGKSVIGVNCAAVGRIRADPVNVVVFNNIVKSVILNSFVGRIVYLIMRSDIAYTLEVYTRHISVTPS